MIRRLAWALLDRLGPRPWRLGRGPARGLRVYAPARRGLALGRGQYEPHVIARLAELAHRGATAIDAGAHLGAHTLALACSVGPRGRVFAFEPEPTAGALLDRTLRRNRLEQVERLDLALSDREGAALLRRTANEAVSLLVPEVPAPADTRDTVPVRTTTLDRWACERTLDRMDLLKIDVEGSELALLRGARRTLERFRPVIVCELHLHPSLPASPSQAIAELRAQGYEVSRLGPGLPLDESIARAENEPPSEDMRALHAEAVPSKR